MLCDIGNGAMTLHNIGNGAMNPSQYWQQRYEPSTIVPIALMGQVRPRERIGKLSLAFEKTDTYAAMGNSFKIFCLRRNQQLYIVNIRLRTIFISAFIIRFRIVNSCARWCGIFSHN